MRETRWRNCDPEVGYCDVEILVSHDGFSPALFIIYLKLHIGFYFLGSHEPSRFQNSWQQTV